MESKKDNINVKSVIYEFAYEKKILYFLTFIMSGLTGLMQIVPFYIIYKLVGELVDKGMALGMDRVVKYAILIMITQVAGVIFNFISLISSHYLAFRVEKNMRKKGVEKLLELPIGFFQNEDSGRLRRIIDDNASKTHLFLAHILPDTTMAFVIPIALLILMVLVDIRLGIVCFIGIFLSIFFLGRIMRSDMKERMAEYAVSGENLNISGVEYIRGIPIVKVFNQSVESFQKFYHAIMDYDEKSKNMVFRFKRPMLLTIISANAPAILLGPITLILLRNESNSEELIVKSVFYIIIAFFLLISFMKIISISEAKSEFAVSVEKLYGILRLKTIDIMEKPKIEEKGIVFKDVSFTYPNREDKVFDNLSFHFKHGRNYALIGGSGSGKSTLIKLIARIYDVDSGGIYIDGKDVRSYGMEELLDKMAIVFQETSLLKGSLRENITMGKDYSDDEVLEVIEKSQSLDILERMNNDINTFIGTKGTFVSGGEAQRINLARAFLKRSNILLLDEASAYADTENEALIRKSIENLKKDKLTISIAHRLNSIKNADEILVLKDGKIADSGSHEELMENSEEYRNLFNEYKESIDWKIDTKEGE